MFCENCGYELGDGQKFCPKCGNKIESISEVKVEKNSLINNSEIKKFDITGTVYMHRHQRTFNTIVSIDGNRVHCELSNYILKKGKSNTIDFNLDEISDVRFKRSLVLDVMTKLRFGAGVLCVLVGFMIPLAALLGIFVIGLTCFMSSDPALVIKLKNGKSIKVFYNNKNDVTELFDILTSK